MDERALFDGVGLSVDGRRWVVSVENDPGASANDTDLRIFDLALHPVDDEAEVRRLRLLASHAGIQVENHTPMLQQCVRDFLRSGLTRAQVRGF